MGIIHRDIKPENILLCPGTMNARITDFTNAWVAPIDNAFISVQDTKPLCYREVYSRNNIGTLSYLAPEMHCNAWYGPAVDWWALGCVVYDLFTKSVST